jgi:hypothetical protein
VHDGASARVAAVLLPQTSAAVRVVNVDADLDGGPIGSVSTKCGVGVPEPIDAEIRDAEATARGLLDAYVAFGGHYRFGESPSWKPSSEDN